MRMCARRRDSHFNKLRRQLQDNITQHWDAPVIADVVRPYIVQYDVDTVRRVLVGALSCLTVA